jgi:nicotinamide-nucleotide amidase
MNSAKLCIIGSEVTNGFILDRNSQFFAQELTKLGVSVSEIRVIPDDHQKILKTLSEFKESGEFIITSGGLGPTDDDLTVDVLCELIGRPSVYSKKAKRKTELVFKRRLGTREPEGNSQRTLEQALRQCRLPEGAIELDNSAGLAPGIFLQDIKLVALPGFPMEIKAIWPEVQDLLKELVTNPRALEIIPIWGIGESNLFSKLSLPEDITVGVHALPFGCRLFLSSEKNKVGLEQTVKEIKSQFNGQICDDPVHEIYKILEKQSLTLSTCESCTGGLAASLLTQQAGISSVFKGSVVAYANEVKVSQLGVNQAELDNSGAVSKAVAAEMALAGTKVLGTDYCLSFTGVAGPGGGSKEKPVGTVFIGLATPDYVKTARFSYPLDRERFQKLTVYTGFLALWQSLTHESSKGVFPLTYFRS